MSSEDATAEHRRSLLSLLEARVARLRDDELEDADDEDEHATRARIRLGPMVEAAGFANWREVAAAVGCSPQYLMRLRRGVDGATEGTINRLAAALLVPPELALVALRRPWTGWRW